MSISAAVFYGVCSGSMTFVNKVVLTTYDFHFPSILMLCQLVFTAAVLELARRWKLLDIPSYTLDRAKMFAIPSCCYALHTAFALVALTDLSIPIYNVLRRLIPIVSLVLARVILHQHPSSLVILSVVLIVSGCIIAGIGDLGFSVPAYTYALASCFTQSVYLTYVQKTNIETDLPTLSIVHINSINSLPVLSVYTLIMTDTRAVADYPSLSSADFIAWFVLAVVMGSLLNYSMFLCAALNSALTVSIVGIIKSVLSTIIGFFTFGGIEPTVLTVTGITLNTGGGVLYSYAKYQEKVRKITETKEAPNNEL